MGSESFLEGIQSKLVVLAKWRRILESDGELQLREEMGTYNNVFDGKNVITGPLNTYSWDTSSRISAS